LIFNSTTYAKKRREMPNVQQGSYIPPGADNMPRIDA
jgi:hypothetical protein